MAWHMKRTYLNGKVIHPRGGGILLDAKHKVESHLPSTIKEFEHIKGFGLTEGALKRLEALKPRALEIPKRQNIKF